MFNPITLSQHMKVENLTRDDEETIHFTYQLERGFCKDKLYGIKLAEMTKLNKQIIETAKQYSEQISEYQNEKVCLQCTNKIH